MSEFWETKIADYIARRRAKEDAVSEFPKKDPGRVKIVSSGRHVEIFDDLGRSLNYVSSLRVEFPRGNSFSPQVHMTVIEPELDLMAAVATLERGVDVAVVDAEKMLTAEGLIPLSAPIVTGGHVPADEHVTRLAPGLALQAAACGLCRAALEWERAGDTAPDLRALAMCCGVSYEMSNPYVAVRAYAPGQEVKS